MDCSGSVENGGFICEWIIDNFSYGFKRKAQDLRSPPFQLGRAKWTLRMFSPENSDCIQLGVTRDVDCQGPVSFSVGFQCTVREALNESVTVGEIRDFKRGETHVFHDLVPPEETQMPASPSTDSVTVFYWLKSGNDFANIGYCLARTTIEVKSLYRDWKIHNFSALEAGTTLPFDFSDNGAQCKTFIHLRSTPGLVKDELIVFQFESFDEQLYCGSFRLSLLHAGGYTIECCREELVMDGPHRKKNRQLFLTKERLVNQDDLYLPEDTLALKCEGAFATGNTQSSIENRITGGHPYPDRMLTPTTHRQGEPKGLIDSTNAFQGSKSLNNGKTRGSVELQTKTKTFHARKSALIARSPVFEAMFNTHMKENIEGRVHMGDLKDKTVGRIIEYAHTASVKDLNDWESALELYEAADKYQILSLKEKCSEFLKYHLRAANACRILVLSDMHSDEGLKAAAQDCILRNRKDILNSVEWMHLMTWYLKLAAETMHLGFKK